MAKQTITTPANDPLLVNASRAAATLGIGTRLLWSIGNRGELPRIQIGRRVLYDMRDIYAFIEARKHNGVHRR